MKKRIISLFLAVTMIASLIVAIPVTNVSAAETITDEALFMTYPTYLSNSEMDEGLSKAEAAYYAVINSYSKSDEAVAKAVTMLGDGVEIAFRESLAVLGITSNYYETNLKKAARKYMKSMLKNESVIEKASKKVDKAYKGIKTIYSTATAVAKEEMILELTKVAKENDIGITAKAMDAYVDCAYESGTLKNDLKAIGELNNLWKYVLEFSELYAIEMTTLDMLMEELIMAGQDNSDLCIGLALLKEDIEKDDNYILENYATKFVINILSDIVDDLVGVVVGGVHVSLIKSCIKIFTEYIYVDAKADEIIQAIMQTSFVNSLDICVSRYRLKFLQGTATKDDIETYKNLYAASIAARISVLDACYDVAKITDKFSLGGDCNIWKDMLEYNYTYDNYIKWCKQAVEHDIANAELDKATGQSTITDALNEETIKARLDKIRAISLYKPNVGETFNGTFDGARGSIGFATKVFNYIFDKYMGNRVENRYNHVLTNNKNVRVIGRLEESSVTEEALKELFKNVRIGDILLTSGQYDDVHAMVVISVEEDGVIVYDSDSKYNPDAPEDMATYTIQEYKITFKKMADAFSKSGKYNSVPGISVYRAINKVNSTNSGSNLYYEEYDDSVNYVIEDGVLKGYNGSRTTIEIPDGVTRIDNNCFENNKKIKYVYMPDTVTEIGSQAFLNCTNLQYIKVSANLKEIYAMAFYSCSSLYNIQLPDGLYAIWSAAFRESGLKSINIPDSVEIIEWYAFTDCINLQTITIGKKVRRFYQYALDGCDNLKMVYWNSSDKGMNNGFGEAFGSAGKNNGGFTVIVGNNVTSIPDEAFRGAVNLNNVILPDGLTRIGKRAFDGCYSLVNITIPDSLKRIEEQAFSDCNFRSITIPEGVSYIGKGAFWCNSLETVYWNAVSVSDLNNTVTSFSSEKGLEVVFGDDVQSIPNYALQGCNVVKIKIGESVVKIGDCAFNGCNVNELILPDGLTYIGWAALGNLHNLTELVIPDSVTTVEWGAFQQCSNLTSITLPVNTDWEAIDGYFFGLPRLYNIYISPLNEIFESIDGILYAKNTDNTLAIVPGGRETLNITKECNNISMIAFDWAGKLKDIVVEDGNTAFSATDGILYSYNGEELVKYPPEKDGNFFEVPQTVTSIGYSAFAGCKNLKSVVLPEGLITIPDLAFSCSRISNITIPDTVTDIRYVAFERCENLNSINIPASVSAIYEAAFINCTNLTDVYYAGSESDWKKINIGPENDSLLNANIHYAESDDTDEDIEYREIMEYSYESPAGFNSYGEIYVPHFSAGDKTYLQVNSKNYSGKYALMDVETGEITIDNLSRIDQISEYSDLICYTTANDQYFIYDLEKQSVVCELAGLGSIGYGGHFSEDGGFVLLKSDGKLHFITNEGEIGPAADINCSSYGNQYNHVLVWGYLGEGWYQVGVGNNYMGLSETIGIVNQSGQVIYDIYAERFKNGLAVAEKDGKYGAIDSVGNFIIPNEYDEKQFLSGSENIIFKKGDGYYEFDTSGNLVSQFVPNFDLYDGMSRYIGNGMAIVYNKENSYDWKHGIVNENNEIILPIMYREISAYDGFMEDICCICVEEKVDEYIYGAIDKDGNIVIPFEYEFLEDFSEGLAYAKKEGKYGFVDKEGNVVIPFEYDSVYNFSEGLAVARKNEKYGFIDKEGNVVIPFMYEDASSFSNGIANVWQDYDSPSININKNNEVVPSTEPLPKYSLTDEYDWENNIYEGGIKNNETGEVVDLSHLNLLPCILGENGDFVIGFNGNFTKVYRIFVDDMFGNVEEPDYTPGDLNGDSEVNVRDVILLRRFITGGYGVEARDDVADINKDGGADVRDVITLRRFIAGGYGIEL